MSDSEDPDAAADRLEAALERIAQAMANGERPVAEQAQSVHTQDIAARLDELIDRLRLALGKAG
jgi:hypothetical protein